MTGLLVGSRISLRIPLKSLMVAGADLRLVLLTTSAVSRFSCAGHTSVGRRISLRGSPSSVYLFFAVFADFLKSFADGAALEPTGFMRSFDPALMRSCFALMFAYSPAFMVTVLSVG
jgi:hypothetical protein